MCTDAVCSAVVMVIIAFYSKIQLWINSQGGLKTSKVIHQTEPPLALGTHGMGPNRPDRQNPIRIRLLINLWGN